MLFAAFYVLLAHTVLVATRPFNPNSSDPSLIPSQILYKRDVMYAFLKSYLDHQEATIKAILTVHYQSVDFLETIVSELDPDQYKSIAHHTFDFRFSELSIWSKYYIILTSFTLLLTIILTKLCDKVRLIINRNQRVPLVGGLNFSERGNQMRTVIAPDPHPVRE